MPQLYIFKFTPIVLTLMCSLTLGVAGCTKIQNIFDKDTVNETTSSNEGDSASITLSDAVTGNASPSGASANGLEKLEGLKGVKTDQLFSQKIRDQDERFDRIEGVIENLYSEFEILKPSIIQLVAIEKDLKFLTDALK